MFLTTYYEFIKSRSIISYTHMKRQYSVFLFIFFLIFSINAEDIRYFRFASTLSPSHPFQKSAIYFKNIIQWQSKKNIQIKISGDGELGSADQILEQLLFGGIAFALIDVQQLYKVAPDLQKDIIKSVGKNRKDVYQYFQQNKTDIEKTLNQIGIIPLAFFFPKLRCYYGLSKTPTSIKGLQGKKIGIGADLFYNDLSNLINCTGIVCNTSNIYTNLTDHTIDAEESSLIDFFLTTDYYFASNISITDYAALPTIIAINSVVYNNLSAAEKNILSSAALRASIYGDTLLERSEEHAINQIKQEKVFCFMGNLID